MTHRGRVLVIEEGSCGTTAPLWDSMRGQGFDVSFAPIGDSGRAVGRTGRPDVVLLNLVAAAEAGERERYLDAAARLAMGSGARRVPVIAVGDPGEPGRPLGISDVLPAPFSGSRLASRIGMVRRLAVMQSELRRRVETAAEFGVDSPEVAIPPADSDANVLVIGFGRHYLAVENALARQAVVIGAFSRATAVDYLSRRAFDAIVVDMRAEKAIECIAELRADPTLFSLPVVALVEDRDLGAYDRLVEAGANEIVAASEIEADLPRRTAAVAAEYRFREALRSVYARGRHLVTSDSLTGLYGRGFLMAHLARSLAEARQSGEPLSVVGLEVGELRAVNRAHGYAAGDHLLRQIGLTIARLVRGEDLSARVAGGRFALILPGTAVEEAEGAMRRLTAVLRRTRFSLPGAVGAIETDPDARAVEGRGTDPEAVLARAFGHDPVDGRGGGRQEGPAAL
ncbi:diguanylate cyclase [Prosthecomicrobium sp. N25]|uniref:diguanylate cyclase n=1 Tax=Prosthecomicrobium sp. N25 TaxID=3129254 RepID=UPI0030771AA4